VKKHQVRIGETYTVKVSGRLATIRITGSSSHGGWVGINTKTNREVRIRTAARLRGAMERE